MVLGVGNLLYTDEGFGVHAARALEGNPQVPAHVEVYDGGTQGIYLLPRVESADRLIFLDAALPNNGTPQLKVYRNDEIRALLQPAVSAHQSGIHTLMAMAKLHDQLPDEVVLIAAPAVNLEMSVELSPQLAELLPVAVDKALEVLLEWERD